MTAPAAPDRPTEVAGYIVLDHAMLDDGPQLDALRTELDTLLDHCAARDAPGATIGERRYEPAYPEPDVDLAIRQRMADDLAEEEGREPFTVRRLAYRWARADLHWPDP